MRLHRLLVLAALPPLCVVSGCSMLPGMDKEPAYKSASTTKQLEVPPDLSRPEMDENYVLPQDQRASAKAMEAEEAGKPGTEAEAAAEVLPQYPDMRIEHDGPDSWLVVKATPEELWPRLEKFWATQGLTLKRADPKLGVMETDWAERNLGIKGGSIKELFAQTGILSGFQDSGLRDKFYLRLARDGDETDIFLSHRGAEEVPINDTQTRWVSRPSEPYLVAETAASLMVYLGAKEETAKQMVQEEVEKLPRSEVVEYDGGPAIKITGDERYIWSRLGNVLDSSGLMVDDQNRKKGIYYITYLGDQAEKGFMSKLFGVSSGPLEYETEYQVRLTRVDDVSYATVHDKDGKRLTKDKARDALELISQAFN
jgi:outer membrane protein assembly factor BamC